MKARSEQTSGTGTYLPGTALPVDHFQKAFFSGSAAPPLTDAVGVVMVGRGPSPACPTSRRQPGGSAGPVERLTEGRACTVRRRLLALLQLVQGMRLSAWVMPRQPLSVQHDAAAATAVCSWASVSPSVLPLALLRNAGAPVLVPRRPPPPPPPPPPPSLLSPTRAPRRENKRGSPCPLGFALSHYDVM